MKRFKLNKIFGFLRNGDNYNFEYKSTFHVVLALICYSSGGSNLTGEVGNILKYTGGSVNYIPMAFFNFVIILPLIFQVLGLTQYSGRGVFRMWDMAPMWRGIVYGQIPALVLNILYITSLTTYSLHYTILSLHSEPSWIHCPSNFSITNTSICYETGRKRDSKRSCVALYGKILCEKLKWYSATEYFWNHGIHEGKYKIVHSSIWVFMILFLTVRKSALSVQLYAPVLVFLPTILHTLLLIMSFTLPGIKSGYEYSQNFEWKDLLDARVWERTFGTTLKSFSTGMGGFAMLGSQNSFRSPLNFISYVVLLFHFAYTLITSITCINFIGVISHREQIVKMNLKHQKLWFVYLPYAIYVGHNEEHTYWVFVMFLANFLCFFRNLALFLDVLLNFLYEHFTSLKMYSNLCTLFMCILIMLISQIMASANVQHVGATFLQNIVFPCLMILTFYQTLVVAFFYGAYTLKEDIYFMMGFLPASYWVFLWYLMPAVIMFNYVTNHLYLQNKYGVKNYNRLPLNAATIVSFFIVPLIYCCCYIVYKKRQGWPWMYIFKPTQDWGPSDKNLKKSRDMFSSSEMTEEYLYRQQRLKHSKEKRRELGSSITQANQVQSSSDLFQELTRHLSFLKMSKSLSKQDVEEATSVTSRFPSLPAFKEKIKDVTVTEKPETVDNK